MTVPVLAPQMAVPLQSAIGGVADDVAFVAGLALVAGTLSALVALLYRWYVREQVPSGLPILIGLSGVAVYLNTSQALRQVIGGAADPVDETAVLFNVVAFLISAVTARAAITVGDRIASDVFVASGGREVQADVSRMVQAVGRVITVDMPDDADDIDDIVGYDPVPDETKAKLAGRTFVFPRRLTVEELRDRLVTRLKADYAVGHVDVDLTEDGEVAYLAVGSRAAGIGPTLPPETSAVAVRADPAFSASSGDLVQVWQTEPQERVLTAELRGVADDVVTLAIDAADTRKLDDETEYKLVTLPVEKRADREFASLLRAADETMAAITVEAGSALAGQPLGALDVAVVAVRPTEGAVEPLPPRNRRIEAGEALYIVATPDAIRQIEAGATAAAEVAVEAGSEMPPEHHVGPDTPIEGEEVEAPGAQAETVTDRAAGEPDATVLEEQDATVVDEPTGDKPTEYEPTEGESTEDGSTEDERTAGDTEAAETVTETEEDVVEESTPAEGAAEEPEGEADTDESPSEEGPADERTDTDGQDDEPVRPDGVDDLSDADVPGLEPLEGEGEDGSERDDEGEAGGAGSGGRDEDEGEDELELDDPDLADLPGTDVEELAGTDVEELAGTDVGGLDDAPDEDGWTTGDELQADEEENGGEGGDGDGAADAEVEGDEADEDSADQDTDEDSADQDADDEQRD